MSVDRRGRRLFGRGWRGLVFSALAGSGLTAVGLGGPLAGGALGAEAPTGSGSTTTGTTEQPTTTETNPESTSTTTTPTGSTTSPSGSTTSTSTVPATTSTPAPTPAPSTTTSTESTPSVRPSTGETGAPAVVVHRKQQTTAGGSGGSGSGTHTPNPSGTNAGGSSGTQPNSRSSSSPGASSQAGAATNNVAAPPQLVAAQASAALEAMLSGSTVSAQALDFYRIPLFLLPIYQAAAVQYDVPWPILAAINEIETDYGTDLSVSSAGAEGWMQFEPGTWLQYGVDALNAGYADPYNPVDAIFAAARYLHTAGAAQNLNTAIFAYNHSTAYVESVLLRAKLIAAYPDQVVATLTGLVDGRPPVTGTRIGWSAPDASLDTTASLPSSSSATAGASPASPSATGAATGSTAPSPTSAATGSAAPGTVPAPTPAGAVAASAGGSPTGSAGTLQLVDIASAPNAHVVAVQDGRIVKLGHSRRLGSYIVLQDVYGDEFTYAGLGHIARTYTPSQSQAGADSERQASRGTANAANASTLAGSGFASAANASAQPTPGAIGVGKVRVFAHPGNPDARVAMRMRAAARTGANGPRPLRAGAVVSEGTVLGAVSVPPNAKDGHLRFAIRPAGDTSTIDPRAILENWTQLDAALHPQGARGNPGLLGATAADVFLMSKSELERAVLADPGIALSSCSRHEVASGAIDARALAAIAFLSRSGLAPTVGTLRCGAYDAVGYVQPGHAGDAVAIVAINGVPISGHQGAGSITDTTIRTLLTIQGRFAPAQIVSLMRYPNAPTTLARADHGAYVELAFPPASARARGSRASVTTGSGSASTSAASGSAQAAQSGTSQPAASAAAAGSEPGAGAAPLAVTGQLSSTQWEQLIARIAALPAPAVAVKPSSAAIPDR